MDADRMEYCNNTYYMYMCMIFPPDIFSLDWNKYKWTGIGAEGATALADPRVIKNFKTLE